MIQSSRWLISTTAILAPLLTACSAPSMKNVNISLKESEQVEQQARDYILQQRGQKNNQRPTVQVSTKQWVSTTPLSVKKGLPPALDCQFIWRPSGGVSLNLAAQEITQQCGLAVRVASDVTLARATASNTGTGDLGHLLFGQGNVTASGSPARISGGQDIKWNGKLSGFLDLLSSRFEVNWKYESGAKEVVIHRLETRTMRIYAFDDKTRIDSTVKSGLSTNIGSDDVTSGGSSGGGSGSGSGISGDSSSNQATTVTMETSIMNDIERSVKAMLTPGVGQMSLSRGTGLLTVTDLPSVLDRIETTIRAENETITKQVLLNVNVLSVTLTDTDQNALDWNLVYKTVNGKWGINLSNTTPGVDPSAIGGSVSILDTSGSPWAGSKAMIDALSMQGKVSTVRSPSVTTLNLQPAPIQIGTLKSYLKAMETSAVAQVGTTTSIVPGTVTSGYNMSLLPFVMDEKEMLLKININMSGKPTFEMVSSGDSKAQFPTYDVQIFDQKVRIRSGETLVLSGFEESSNDATKRGTFTPGFFGLGGSWMRQTQRTVIVLLITPIVLS